MTDLPPPTPNPCDECPWRRDALRGWLGPLSAEEWVEVAHGELPIACHKTIKHADENGEGDWSDPGMRQCAGAAIYRSNVCKSPRDPAVSTLPADREKVFGWRTEFVEHHRSLGVARRRP